MTREMALGPPGDQVVPPPSTGCRTWATYIYIYLYNIYITISIYIYSIYTVHILHPKKNRYKIGTMTWTVVIWRSASHSPLDVPSPGPWISVGPTQIQ
jgi:hypothetical protein